MPPLDLTPERLKAYPPLALALVSQNIDLIRRLPLPFASLLLREAIQYDWKFPMERREIESDFTFLNSISLALFDLILRPFRDIQLATSMEGLDWVNDPVAFSEKLSAHLWSTHQIDSFRSAAVKYMDRRTAALPPKPPAVSGVTLVLIGEGVDQSRLALFRKLRPHGTYFADVEAKNGLDVFLRVLSDRVSSTNESFAHWYIDGGHAGSVPEGVTSLSYGGLSAARAMLQRELKEGYEKRVGSELMRSQLAQKRPEELGLVGSGNDAVLNRFGLSILTEGSGTQIYSTTFVQWAAREALRRAQPVTMLARFRPRQRERPMQELLMESRRIPDLDPAGSLVDADMGAYYTWLNQQRLPGANRSSFLATFEGHGPAIAIGPAIRRGMTSERSINILELAAGLTDRER